MKDNNYIAGVNALKQHNKEIRFNRERSAYINSLYHVIIIITPNTAAISPETADDSAWYTQTFEDAINAVAVAVDDANAYLDKELAYEDDECLQFIEPVTDGVYDLQAPFYVGGWCDDEGYELVFEKVLECRDSGLAEINCKIISR